MRSFVLTLLLALICICASANAAPEAKTADVLKMDLVDTLSDSALKELVSSVDEDSPVFVKESDFNAAAVKTKLKQLIQTATPAFDAFFKYYPTLLKLNIGLLSSITVAPLRTGVKPDKFKNSEFRLTLSVVSEDAGKKVNWADVPEALRQLEVAPVFDFGQVKKQQAKANQQQRKAANLPSAKALIPSVLPTGKVSAFAELSRVLSRRISSGLKTQTKAPNKGEIFPGGEIAGDAFPLDGTLGFIVKAAGRRYAATNGHVCGANGNDAEAEEFGGVGNRVPTGGVTLGVEVAASIDTCLVGPLTAAWSCETRDGQYLLENASAVPGPLVALNMLIGRRITMYGSQAKGTPNGILNIQRSYAKIRYWGLILPPFGAWGHYTHYLGLYIALQYDPATWVDNRNAIHFGVPGDSGTGVSSYPYWGQSSVVAHYVGGTAPGQNVFFHRHLMIPIHKHIEQWTATLGAAASFC